MEKRSQLTEHCWRKKSLISPNARTLLAAAVAIAAECIPKVLEVARQIMASKVQYKPLKYQNYLIPSKSYNPRELQGWLEVTPESAKVDPTFDRILSYRNSYGHWRRDGVIVGATFHFYQRSPSERRK